MLRVDDLSLSYGGALALSGVSFEVPRGAIVAIVGSNGAGKSSLIRAIAGMEKPEHGSITLAGKQIRGLSSHVVCELGIGQVAEGRQLFPSLTVEDNLQLGGSLARARKQRKQTLEQVYTLFPRLRERHTQQAGTMSGGEQQMLAIGRCLMARPDLILFDEPSLGLSPAMVQEVFRTIRALHAEGVTILLVEQNVALSLRIADLAHVLENGRIVLSGAGDTMLRDERVRRAYLGL